MPVITVIVPVFKVENYIRECVDSILGQSFQDFDLVLVDDGSPDACPQICDDYAAQDKRITVIHKPNGGLSDARNAGIDWAMTHSDSDWLAFVDSDDYLHPDFLKTMYLAAGRESADLVICDFVRVNDQNQIIEEEHSFFDRSSEDKTELFKLLYSNWRIHPAWNKLYQKTIFAALRFAVGKIHEDEFAIHHVLRNCRKAVFISDGLYFYRIRENSIMATETPKSRLDRMEALISQYEFSKAQALLPVGVGTTPDYVEYFRQFESDYDKQNARRYRALKKRFARIYFSRKENRNPKRFIHFYFPKLLKK